MIRFLLNHEVVELAEFDAGLTVLNYLREHRKMKGSKEGCAAGDCGACTVALAELTPAKNSLHYRTINSCIALMSAVDGKQLITVEHLCEGATLHPVQQALVDYHGSQCGFCTPGLVMSMFALYHKDIQPHREQVSYALSGNLCRCTGYRPIIDAATAVCTHSPADKFKRNEQQTIAALKELQSKAETPERGLLLPQNREQLARFIKEHPEAPLVAGNTDLGLEVTQKLKQYDCLISLSQVAELKECREDDDCISLGAACSLSDIEPHLLAVYPQLKEILERFASLPIRNQATLGGNLANASPIGDMPPVLLALGAIVVVDNGEKSRNIPVSKLFTSYRQTVLCSNEWISRILIPKPAAPYLLRAYKVSKRFEDDISAVCAVFHLYVEDGVIKKVASGFGGVAVTPVSCEALHQALVGKRWSSAECIAIGKEILMQAFSPIDDVRATAEYRNQLLGNLWHRFWLENQQDNHIETRVVTYA
ncbi:xanthine dehydrogenase small subunit [Alteromonas pelagimontana]|uniref:Xanthine dehydrogenase small subunit n=1 Tax=Alteromonas pelagimontana TaxID=1858656 RepID=A0A6M4MAF0_9ALTE|nr:xanthine dehydrogenase small subunit [Alteromonas pelagimontana]QJR79545.1 xanthine dehydrogenase small subunit [Alteromonas pelagimontana]